MRPAMRILAGLGAGLGALAVLWTAFDLAISAGVFRTIYYTPLVSCEPVPSPPGPEDLVIDRTTGWVYISAADRRWTQAGGIYAMRFDAPEKGVLSLTAGLVEGLRPRGLSLWRDPEGAEKRLFVLSVPADGAPEVRVFRIDDTGPIPALTPLATLTSPLLRSPQDLAADGPLSAYVTNATGHGERSWFRGLEVLLRWDLADVILVSEDKARVVANGLTFANGIVLSGDGERLFVSETTDGHVRVYRRDKRTGDLSLNETMAVGPGPDNLDFDGEGRLWMAGHPDLMSYRGHVQDSEALSPSVVREVKLAPAEKINQRTRTVFADPGSRISGASVAARYDGRLLIGSVYASHLLICKETQ